MRVKNCISTQKWTNYNYIQIWLALDLFSETQNEGENRRKLREVLRPLSYFLGIDDTMSSCPSACCDAWLQATCSALMMDDQHPIHIWLIFPDTLCPHHLLPLSTPNRTLCNYWDNWTFYKGFIFWLIKIMRSQGLGRHVPGSRKGAEFCNCNKNKSKSNNGYHKVRSYHVLSS